MSLPARPLADLSLRPAASSDVEAGFRALVRSPLRAGLLRFLHTRPAEVFDVETLMSTFGCLRVDVDNCLGELVRFGVVRQVGTTPPRYGANVDGRPGADALVEAFIRRHATPGPEDQAPSVQRFKIGRAHV